jgi:ketosteroid isomerase-like protein
VVERFKTKGSEPEIVESNALVFTMREGKIARVQIFLDRAEAFGSVKLSAPTGES